MDQQQVSFADIYRAKYKLICQYIRRNIGCDVDSTEDIANETFLILFEKWDTIISKSEAALTVYLYHTADNLMLAHRKKLLRRGKVMSVEPIEKLEVIEDENFIDEIQEDEGYRQLLQVIKGELTLYEWELFEWIYIKKEPPAKIMEQFHIDKIKLYTCRRRIKNIVKKVDQKRKKF